MQTMKKVWTYLVIAMVALVASVNYELFIFPNQFAPSGVNGICTMIQYLFGISVGYLSLLINVPLAIWCYLEVSKPIALRSMVYVVTFSLGLLLLDHIDLSPFAYVTENGTSKILGPLVAGVIQGYVYSILVKASAYTGGTDFVSAIIHKRSPEKSVFGISFTLNAVIAVASYFVYGYKMEPVILCILYSFMSSTVSDRLMKSGRSAIRCEIVTDHPREISDAIIRRLRHSATLIPAKGMYQGRETHILVCVVNKVQMPALEDIVREYPHTFAVLSDAREVVGNFKRLDSKGMPERELLDKGENQMA